jgi:hypothetical protein
MRQREGQSRYSNAESGSRDGLKPARKLGKGFAGSFRWGFLTSIPLVRGSLFDDLYAAIVNQHSILSDHK